MTIVIAGASLWWLPFYAPALRSGYVVSAEARPCSFTSVMGGEPERGIRHRFTTIVN